MRTATRRVLLLAALLAAGALVALLLRPAPIAVEMATVTRGPLSVTLDEEGKTRVEPRYVVAAPVAGRLLRPALREGDAVRRGMTVARLAPLPLDERGRRAAEAALGAAVAAREEARAAAAAAASVAQRARATLRRQQSLADAGQVALDELEQARASERAAAEALDAARHREQAASCAVEEARAALVERDAQSPPLELCSPEDGVVLRLVEPSERVVPAGAPLLEVGDPRRLEVEVDLLSTDAAGLAPGMPMRLDVGSGRVLPARLRFVEPAAFTKISPLGVEEQRVHAIGDVLASAPGVGHAYRVEASIVLWSAPSVLQVATGAVFRQGEGWACYAVESGRVRLRPVRLGHRGAESVEVLGGLAAGARVVLYPPERLEDGARVEPAR